MDFREAAGLGSSNLRRHKLRSVLTTIGIIMGVAAVIATVTLTASFQSFFEQQFSGTFRPGSFSVIPGQIRTQAGPQGGFFTPILPVFTDRDIQNMRNIPEVKAVIPFGAISLMPGQGVQLGNRTLVTLGGVSAVSTTPDAFSYGLIQLGNGTYAGSPSDVVVGYDVALVIANRFGSNNSVDSIGKHVQLNFADGKTANFTVVGILRQIPFSSVNSQVIIDLRTYYSQTRTLPGTNERVAVYDFIDVAARSVGDVKRAETAVMNYLNSGSDAGRFLAEDDSGLKLLVIGQDEILSFIQTQLNQFGSFIGILGLISLLVGSIGIANTMMVSVTERTREIGIMKATGARRRDILMVFLVEASMISAIGALIGSIVGIALGYGLTQSGLFGSFNLPITFKLEWFPISLAAGVLVGVASGMYPAWRAARVNPVEALRYE